MDENTNPLASGSENVRPSDDTSKPLTLDEAASLFTDEDEEDQGAAEQASDTDSDSETDEPSDTDEGQEAETEEAEEETEPEAEEVEETAPAKDKPLFTLDDGTPVTLKEAQSGYMRQRDYQFKTQIVADERRFVTEQANQLQARVDTLASFVERMLPPAPDPALFQTDPVAHYQQKAMREAALAEFNDLMAEAGKVKQVSSAMSEDDQRKLVAREQSALFEKLPELKNRENLKRFGMEIEKTAQKFGFSEDELAGVLDHRMILALHYASEGMKAREARAGIQKKAAVAPPSVKPAPQRAAQRPATGKEAEIKAARARFARTGSIQDAAKLMSLTEEV